MDRRSGRLQNIVNRIKIRLLSVPRTEMPQRRHGETASGKGEKRRNAQRNGALLLEKQVLYTGAGCKNNPIRIFSDEELRKATNNYDLVNYIGGIEFPYYFKGTIDDNGHEIVVKRTQDSIDSIVTEIVILSSINHQSIVKLLGCCLETERPVLVYEFYSNGSLADNLRKLPWSDRLRIAAEVAEALNYLHTHLSMAIVHRDIKSHNIMLDDHCTAKISGFRCLFTITSDKILRDDSAILGTLMYLEPEYFQTRVLSEKMDVYSFGVVMLELLTGEEVLRLFRSNGYNVNDLQYIDYVNELLDQVISASVNLGGCSSTSPAIAPETAGIIASRVVEEGRPEQIQAFAQVAMNCLRKRGERPTMKEVVLELWRIRSKEGTAVTG